MKIDYIPFIIGMLILLVTLPLATAHGAYPNPAHQYITNESQYLWKLIPIEIKNHFKNSFDINPVLYYNYDSGDDIIKGSGEEDIPFVRSGEHYWSPDEPGEGEYDYGWPGWGKWGSYAKAKEMWEEDVIKNYLKGDINKSYYYLGRVAHLLEDASVPAHMHVDTHLPGAISDDSYEAFIADKQGYWSDTAGKSNFYHWKGSNHAGEEYQYENLTNLTRAQWLEINPKIEQPDYPEYLFKLFWYTAQKTQYFASDDNDGNTFFRDTSNSTFNFSGEYPNIWAGENINLTQDNLDLLNEDYNYSQTDTGDCLTVTSISLCAANGLSVPCYLCDVDEGPNLANISQALMPNAMKATAGLYRLFYDTVNSYHWPTYHYDAGGGEL